MTNDFTEEQQREAAKLMADIVRETLAARERCQDKTIQVKLADGKATVWRTFRNRAGRMTLQQVTRPVSPNTAVSVLRSLTRWD